MNFLLRPFVWVDNSALAVEWITEISGKLWAKALKDNERQGKIELVIFEAWNQFKAIK